MIDPLILCLTLISVWYIINKIQDNKRYNKIEYSQSSIHRIIKDMVGQSYTDHPSKQSQAEKHAEKNSIKVIFMEDKAYWVANNIFYCANAANGDVDTETAEPINTDNMNKTDIDKLLFILDKLRDGSNNDSGGSGNKRL